MRIHLDLLGGLAGDMFIAGMLDAFPELEASVLASISAATGTQVQCRLVDHSDGVLRGRRFEVDAPDTVEPIAAHAHSHAHGHSHDHEISAPLVHRHSHKPWRIVREQLQSASLAPGCLRHAIGIFELLAEAEAHVHGVAVEDVAFHEVGAWDSIADIVGAAHLIDVIGADYWSVGLVPLGSGRVRTAHGLLPVPPPATAALLEGFDVVDDGIPGERVTPTGAAILSHLRRHAPAGHRSPRPERLTGSGTGFGTRRLPGISNCVRVLVFDEAAPGEASGHRQLAVVEFEVDDQSAEDLAMGLDHLRAHPAIFDVVQGPIFGKKGRMMTAVRALAAPARIDEVIEACFRETTTIGLRHHLVQGAALPRTHRAVSLGDDILRVKIVGRPGGATAKAESDDVRAVSGHAIRRALRSNAEQQALRPDEDLTATEPSQAVLRGEA